MISNNNRLVKKELRSANKISHQEEAVESERMMEPQQESVYVEFTEEVHDWPEASKLVRQVKIVKK